MSTLSSDGPAQARRPPPGWRRAAALLLLAWAGWAFAATGWAVGQDLLQEPDPGAVAAWRLGTPRSLSLHTFLRTMEVHLPADQVVAFSHHTNDADQRFFLTLWTAYFLPEQRVVMLPGTVATPDLGAVPADYVVTYNHRLTLPGLEEVARHPSGALYRVTSGAGSVPPARNPRREGRPGNGGA